MRKNDEIVEFINLNCDVCVQKFTIPVFDRSKVGFWALKKATCSAECGEKNGKNDYGNERCKNN